MTVRAPVRFAPYSATVLPAQRARLARLRARLAGVRAVVCTGHTNGAQASAYNTRLARARAAHVCGLLASGDHATRAVAAPVVASPAAAGQRERRAEIRLVY